MIDENQAGENSQSSDENTQEETETAGEVQLTRKQMLMKRARLMGISFSNNISEDALAEKINAKLGADQTSDDTGDEDETSKSEDAESVEDVQNTEDTEDTEDQEQTQEASDEAQSGLSDAERAELEELRSKVKQMNASEALNPLAGDSRGQRPAKALSKRDQIRREALKLVRCRIMNLDPKKKDLPGEILCVGNKYIGTVRKFIPFGEVTDDGYHIPYVLYQELEARRFLNIRTTREKGTGHIRTHTTWAKEFAIEVLPPLTQEELDKLAAAQKAAGSIE